MTDKWIANKAAEEGKGGNTASLTTLYYSCN